MRGKERLRKKGENQMITKIIYVLADGRRNADLVRFESTQDAFLFAFARGKQKKAIAVKIKYFN